MTGTSPIAKKTDKSTEPAAGAAVICSWLPCPRAVSLAQSRKAARWVKGQSTKESGDAGM